MSPIIIDAEIVSEIPNIEVVNEAPKLLPLIPTSIVCPHCKQETGFTKEAIVEMLITEDISCPNCNKVIYSCVPERNTYSWQGPTSHHDWDY